MTKEKLALEIIDRLKKEYPDAGCTLDYDHAWKLCFPAFNLSPFMGFSFTLQR